MTLTTRVVTDIEQLAAVRDDWAALLIRSANNVPTLSPTWLLQWWRTFGASAERALTAVLFFDGGRLVGLAPLLSRPLRSRIGIPFRRIELMASGEDEAEEISSEYIGIIAERSALEAVADALATALARRALGPWDELSLEAMNGDSSFPILFAAALESHGIAAHTEVTSVAHHIRLPPTWDDYLAALPSTRRYMVRRTMRDFDRWAGTTTRIERAQTPEELARGIRILLALHAERWRRNGVSGAFSAPRFQAFHEAVMPELLAAHALELVWISVHDEPIAVSYNVVWDNKIHFYQSGRSINVPRGIRPGIVMHAHAIRAAIAAGYREYDFLSGDAHARYKADLATDARPIVHLRALRPSITAAARRATELAIDQVRAFRAQRAVRQRIMAISADRRDPGGP